MKISLSKIVLLVLVSFSIVSCSKEDVSETPVETVSANVTYNYMADEVQVLDLINNYRQSIGLNRLERIDFVSVKSEEHTNYMVSTGSMNHNFFQALHFAFSLSRCWQYVLLKGRWSGLRASQMAIIAYCFLPRSHRFCFFPTSPVEIA